jgi:hypothetical protein
MILAMLFGCASVKEINVGQKYENSKSWFKGKWHAMGSKFSSSEAEEKSIKPTEDFATKHRTAYYEHRVKWSGETLALIAKWYTGHYGNWRAIARANPGLNPHRIALGDVICVPPEMMKTQKPLPQKVVAKTLPGYFSHTVTQPDEKFAEIARWYTGDAENRATIAKANPDIDPEFLLVGNEIFIPSPLLKTHRPMVSKSDQIPIAEPGNNSPGDQGAEPTSPASQPKKIQLFGPKQFSER